MRKLIRSLLVKGDVATRPLRSVLTGSETLWKTLRSPTLRYYARQGVRETQRDVLLYAIALTRGAAKFVQVGANDGIQGDPLQPFVEHWGWEGILVEPVPTTFNRLVASHTGTNGRLRFENAAIAQSSGEGTFYAVRADANCPWCDQLSSFSRETILKHGEFVADIEDRIEEITVPCLTFSGLCEKHDVNDLDVLLIDTEGYDYEILRTIDFTAHTPRMIMYEHRHLDPQDQAKALKLLGDAGFECAETRHDTIGLQQSALKEPALAKAWKLVRWWERWHS